MLCSSNDVEDEMHVLLKCGAYKEIRSKLPFRVNEDNIWRLFSSDDINTVKTLCDYIYDVNEKRTTLLEIFT